MRSPLLSSKLSIHISFRRDSLLYRLTSVLLAWAMIMSLLPAYAADQPRVEWVHSWDFDAGPKLPVAAATPVAPRVATRPLQGGRNVSPRLTGNPTIAALQSPALSSNQDSDPSLKTVGGGL